MQRVGVDRIGISSFVSNISGRIFPAWPDMGPPDEDTGILKTVAEAKERLGVHDHETRPDTVRTKLNSRTMATIDAGYVQQVSGTA